MMRLWKIWTPESRNKRDAGRRSIVSELGVWRFCGETGGMRDIWGREEDEREAGKTDWGVSEWCNYSSLQGEGEITTHSMLHTTQGPRLRVFVCVFRAVCCHVCLNSVSVCLRAAHTELYVGGKNMSNKVDSVLISIITAGCTHMLPSTRAAHTRIRTVADKGCFASRLILLGLWSGVLRGFGVWMKISFPALSLCSSGEAKAGRESWI